VTCRDEHALGDELFNLQAGLERWVKLYQRLWPEKPGVELVLDPRTAKVVSNLDEAADVIGAGADEVAPKVEDVHWSSARLGIIADTVNLAATDGI
jgi:hypothetical protein